MLSRIPRPTVVYEIDIFTSLGYNKNMADIDEVKEIKDL